MFDSGWERGAGATYSRAWSTESPCAALATALTTGAPVDPAEDEGFDAVERLGAWEAIAAWATAQQVRTAAELLSVRQGRAASTGVAQQGEFAATAMELATMARVAPATGEHRLYQAMCLVERLPLTFEALEAGRIAYSHARVLVEQTQDCDDSSAMSIDARFWTGPGPENLQRTPTQTRDRVRRIVQRLDPEALRRRAEAARSGRTVRYWSDDDGATGVITMRLPADEARGVFAVIDAVANAAADPPDTPRDQRRSLGQRRADAAVDLIMNGAVGCGTSSGDPTGNGNADDTTEHPERDEARNDQARNDQAGNDQAGWTEPQPGLTDAESRPTTPPVPRGERVTGRVDVGNVRWCRRRCGC